MHDSKSVSRAPARAIALALLLPMAGTAGANTYYLEDVWEIARLDLDTGREVFCVSPGALGPPQIRVSADAVVATDIGGRTYRLDPETGRTLAPAPLSDAWLAAPMEPLPRNLTSTSGITLDYTWGETRHLERRRADGEIEVLHELDGYPAALHVVGDLALFTYAGGTSIYDTGGGEVHAVNLVTGRKAWIYRAARTDPGIAPADWTGIHIDGDRVLVSVNQMIHVVSPATGVELASWPLPRQAIRDWDNPWTHIARLDDRYFVRCYEDLFALDLQGNVLWRFDAGEFASPWPTVHGKAVYVQAYPDPSRAHAMSMTPRSLPCPTPPAAAEPRRRPRLPR